MLFFTTYLPTLLSDENGAFQNVYTVFSGGDDLFLIGPWNTMIALSQTLKKEFEKYACDNPALTFSAGLTLHKSHTPVDKLASAAEEALEQSKNVPEKNALTVFGVTVSWSEVETLLSYREKLQTWRDENVFGSAMLYRLGQLVELAERERKIRKSTSRFYISEVECLKWRAYLGYTLERNVNEKETRTEMAGIQQWFEKYGAGLRIPFWSMLYDHR